LDPRAVLFYERLELHFGGSSLQLLGSQQIVVHSVKMHFAKNKNPLIAPSLQLLGFQ
jgi:hypothetical protein